MEVVSGASIHLMAPIPGQFIDMVAFATTMSIILEFGVEKMKAIINSKLLVVALAICCLGSSCSSSRKKQQQADTAAATSALTTLFALKVANDIYEYGRVQPHLESWNQDEIEVLGIKASMISEFFVWSVKDSTLLWWLSPKSRTEDYSKKSKHERFIMTYGVPLEEWKQKFPLEGPPEGISEDIVLVYFHYSFPTIIGMTGESEVCYVKFSDQSSNILQGYEINDDSWISIQDHQKIWDVVNRSMVEIRNPATKKKKKDSEQVESTVPVKAAPSASSPVR